MSKTFLLFVPTKLAQNNFFFSINKRPSLMSARWGDTDDNLRQRLQEGFTDTHKGKSLSEVLNSLFIHTFSSAC